MKVRIEINYLYPLICPFVRLELISACINKDLAVVKTTFFDITLHHSMSKGVEHATQTVKSATDISVSTALLSVLAFFFNKYYTKVLY